MNRLVLAVIAAVFTFFASPFSAEAMQFEYPTAQIAEDAVPGGTIVTDTSFESGVGLRSVRYEVHRTADDVFAQWDRDARRGETHINRGSKPYKCTKCARPAAAVVSMNAAVDKLEKPNPDVPKDVRVMTFSDAYHGPIVCSLGTGMPEKVDELLRGSNPDLAASAATPLSIHSVVVVQTISANDPAPSADSIDHNGDMVAVDPDDVEITIWDDTAQPEIVALNATRVDGDAIAPSNRHTYGFHGALNSARAPYTSNNPPYTMLRESLSRAANNCGYPMYSTQSRLCSRPPEIPR